MRKFELKKAIAGGLPLSVGLCGPSGSGKTFSALRLATGMTRVCGGRIAFIDTEHGRARHYADDFDFDHLALDPPYSPEDYRQALAFAVESGSTTVIIDSMSHEHEGIGGVLEMHEQEVERMVKEWRNATRDSVQLTAWGKPKAQRTRLLLDIASCTANVILCFRAKEKIRPATREEKKAGQKAPVDLGWMPIAGTEFAYEMTALGVLPPNSDGIPDWSPAGLGTQLIRKRPKRFTDILRDGDQLSEAMGEALARWSRGEEKRPSSLPPPPSGPQVDTEPEPQELSGRAEEYMVEVHAATDRQYFRHVADAIGADKSLSVFDKRSLKAACIQKQKELRARAGA